MTLATDPGIYALHARHCASAAEENWDFIEPNDKAIVPFLQALNEHPDLNTRWSCSGHNLHELSQAEFEEFEAKNRNHKSFAAGYIAMSFRENGLVDFGKFYDRLTSEWAMDLSLGKNYGTDIFQMRLTRLLSDMDDLTELNGSALTGWLCLCLYIERIGYVDQTRRAVYYQKLANYWRQHMEELGVHARL